MYNYIFIKWFIVLVNFFLKMCSNYIILLAVILESHIFCFNEPELKHKDESPVTLFSLFCVSLIIHYKTVVRATRLRNILYKF